MQKIKYLKDYKGHKKGDIEIVENNIAHGLIENGIAKLYTAFYDKMMRPRVDIIKSKKNKGRYIIK